MFSVRFLQKIIKTVCKIFICLCINANNINWVSCNQGMARPWVADGGEGLHLRRVAVNTSNKQSWRAE
jgi:hypothetical protein